MNRYYAIHYLGQYLFISILFIIGMSIYDSDLNFHHNVGPIIIQYDKSKFNTLNTPYIITHLSDSHINTFNSKYGENFELCLKSSLLFQPNLYLHTGDVADDFCTDKRPKYGHQCPGDFVEFERIFTKYRPKFNVTLGCAGNHDMFGVYKFDSPHFYFVQACSPLYDNPMKTYEEFLVSKYRVKINKDLTINFVGLNPYTFPTSHPVMMYYGHTWTGFLDRLETVIKSIPSSEKICFYSHYQQASFTQISNPIFSRKSSTGKTITDLIELPNTIGFLSGHYHSKTHLLEHHGAKQEIGNVITQNCQYTETIGFDTKSTNKYGIVTIDNERVVYHAIDPNNQDKCLITYPVPANQTTLYSYFSDEDTPIRIMCFNDKPLNIEIHGDIEGEKITNIKKIKENVYLYEYPLSKLFKEDKKKSQSSDYIIHHLRFESDEWKGQIDFYSKGVVPEFKEIVNNEYFRVMVVRIALPIYIIYLIFITLPVQYPFLKKAERYYFKFLQQGVSDKDTSNYCWFLTLSGISLRLKIQQLNTKYRNVLFIAVIWPLILPLSLMETEGHYGFMSMYFYYNSGVVRYSEHCQDYAIYYYVFIVMPVILASASLAINIPFKGIGGIEAVALIIYGLVRVIIKCWYYQLVESVGPVCEYFSVFALGMIVLYPLLLYNYYKSNDANFNEWYSEGMTLTSQIPIKL